jgi:uncharacterized membrane protein YhaH (DUF805 family)
MKIFSIIALILSTLLVLMLPIVLFVTPFLFDSARGGNDTRIGMFIMTLWSYPLGWVIALASLLVRRLRKSSKKWWESPTAYLFLIPFAQLAVVFLMIASNFMGFEKR